MHNSLRSLRSKPVRRSLNRVIENGVLAMGSIGQLMRERRWEDARAKAAQSVFPLLPEKTSSSNSKSGTRRHILCAANSVTLALLILLASATETASAIPAFAKKTGLRCSACHEAWPKLNAFGQAFRDKGYEIGNERDSPVYASPLYWPASIRITPQWHSERNSAEATNQSKSGVQPVTTQGFDLSGIDLWTAGLLSKDISFVVLPSSDEYGNFHFESAWVRFDKLLKSTWINIKSGKFELDNVVSEKRMLTLSQNGGFYQIYHYLPLVDAKAFKATLAVPGETGASTTGFGLGDNQLGLELAGQSNDDSTRYSVSVLTSSDGSVNLPSSAGYDTFFAASKAWSINSLGPQRFGAFSYIGQAPTRYLTQSPPGGGTPTDIPGSGFGNRDFTRTGGFALLSAKKLDLVPMFTHATENADIALGIPSNEALPSGVQNPSWNGRMLELYYTQNLQFIVIARYEDIRNSRQVFRSSANNFGDLDAETIAFRWMPFMHSRAGLAICPEYSKVHQAGASAIETNQTLRSAFIGLDFAF
jgi:hypothetical protein